MVSAALLFVILLPMIQARGVTPNASLVFTGTFFVTIPFWLLVGVSLSHRLVVDIQGIKQKFLFRTDSLPWSEVSEFHPYIPGRNQLVVGFNYNAAPSERSNLKRYNRRLEEGQGSFYPGWDIPPGQLAELLNQAKRRWGT
jgi:hypothetical protein